MRSRSSSIKNSANKLFANKTFISVYKQDLALNNYSMVDVP